MLCFMNARKDRNEMLGQRGASHSGMLVSDDDRSDVALISFHSPVRSSILVFLAPKLSESQLHSALPIVLDHRASMSPSRRFAHQTDLGSGLIWFQKPHAVNYTHICCLRFVAIAQIFSSSDFVC
jgi:hypothetical protein